MIEFFDGEQLRPISEDEARYRVAEGFEVAAGRCGDTCELAMHGVAHGHTGKVRRADPPPAPLADTAPLPAPAPIIDSASPPPGKRK